MKPMQGLYIAMKSLVNKIWRASEVNKLRPFSGDRQLFRSFQTYTVVQDTEFIAHDCDRQQYCCVTEQSAQVCRVLSAQLYKDYDYITQPIYGPQLSQGVLINNVSNMYQNSCQVSIKDVSSSKCRQTKIQKKRVTINASRHGKYDRF